MGGKRTASGSNLHMDATVNLWNSSIVSGVIDKLEDVQEPPHETVGGMVC